MGMGLVVLFMGWRVLSEWMGDKTWYCGSTTSVDDDMTVPVGRPGIHPGFYEIL